jgi:hypothetical protein
MASTGRSAVRQSRVSGHFGASDYEAGARRHIVGDSLSERLRVELIPRDKATVFHFRQ